MKAKRSMVILALCLVTGLLMVSPSANKNLVYDNDTHIAEPQDNYDARDWALSGMGEATATLTAGKISGVRTLLEIDVGTGGAMFQVGYGMEVSGDFKLVLVDEGPKVTTVAEGSEAGEEVFYLAPGRYRFKAVGRDAYVRCELRLRADGDAAFRNTDGRELTLPAPEA